MSSWSLTGILIELVLLVAHTRSTVQRITSSNSGLWALRHERALLLSAASVIQEELAFVEIRHARMHNALQPCHRLPNEVLKLIFEVGVPSPEDKWPTDEKKYIYWDPVAYQRHVATLSATCSRFRFVVVNTPNCWTYVRLDISQSHKTTPLDVLATRLARSQTLPFDLHIEVESGVRPSDGVIRGLSVILSAHAHRCRSISSFGLEADGDSGLFAPGIALDALQHVNIIWPGQSSNSYIISAVPFIDGIDGLRQQQLLSLKIYDESCCSHDIHDLPIPLRMSNLTRLWLEIPHGVALPDRILQACTALQHLCFGETRWMENALPAVERLPIALPALKSFRMSPGGVPVSDTPPMLAPELVQVRIPPHNICESYDTMFDPDYPRFPSLKRLEFPPSSLDPDTVIEYFREPHKLEELALTCVQCDVGHEKQRPHVISEILGSLSASGQKPGEHAGGHMRHVYMELDCMDSGSDDALVLASIRRLLMDLPEVNVHIYLRDGWIPSELKRWERFAGEHESRLKLFPNASLDLRWPDAWQGWSSRFMH